MRGIRIRYSLFHPLDHSCDRVEGHAPAAYFSEIRSFTHNFTDWIIDYFFRTCIKETISLLTNCCAELVFFDCQLLLQADSHLLADLAFFLSSFFCFRFNLAGFFTI